MSVIPYLFSDGVGDADFLFSQAKPGRRKTMKDSSYVVVQKRNVQRSAYGTSLVPDGSPIKVVCSVEGRAQQAGLFSISGAEDKKPQPQGGLIEVTPIQILAREWPGDIHSQIWFAGDLYDADGSPVFRKSGSAKAQGVEVHARRVQLNVHEPDWKGRIWGTSVSTVA